MINIFKNIHLFLLGLQSRVLTFRLTCFLNKHKKYVKTTVGGCSVEINADKNNYKKQMDGEIKNILKSFKNNRDSLIKYIIKHNTKIFIHPSAKKILNFINEEEGLIIEHTGKKALIINFFLFKKISFKSDAVFLFENRDIDIHFLIQQFYKWYSMQKGFEGFDQKSQDLLKLVNKGQEDNIISKLKPKEILGLQSAISRDIESIDFVIQYAREYEGSKQALEKIKEGLGAKI